MERLQTHLNLAPKKYRLDEAVLSQKHAILNGINRIKTIERQIYSNQQLQTRIKPQLAQYLQNNLYFSDSLREE